VVWPKLLLESFLSETGVFEVGRFVGVLTNAWLVERVRETPGLSELFSDLGSQRLVKEARLQVRYFD
jgi:hypothetical protein